MTKEGYTHIIVPKELHAVLKVEAEAREMSIANHITDLRSRIQSIESLMSVGFDINTDSNTPKKLHKALNCEKSSAPVGI
jgi:hypothetical protein